MHRRFGQMKQFRILAQFSFRDETIEDRAKS